MPDPSATYTQRPSSDPTRRLISIPAALLVDPSQGTVRMVAFHGRVILMPDTPAVESIEQRFRRFADEWISETGLLSDPIRKFMHRSHLKIIGMGEKALPYILKEVERKSGHWFVALDAISPENPVRPEDQINLERTARAWLEWGKDKGLI
jgi:hypothetical protein